MTTADSTHGEASGSHPIPGATASYDSWPILRASIGANAGRLSLFAGALAAALFAVKMLRVARGDPAVALAVAESSAKSAVASGLLVLTAPLLVTMVWLLAWSAAGQAWSATCRQLRRAPAARRLQPFGWLAGCVLAIALSGWLGLAALPWPGAVFCAVFALPAVYLGRWLARPSKKSLPKWFRSPRRALTALVVLFGITAVLAIDTILTPVLDDTMWLPPHRLTVTNGAPVVGFVLSRDNGTLVVLQEADRTVRMLPDSEVQTEIICELGKRTDPRSVWDASRHRQAPHTPPCY